MTTESIDKAQFELRKALEAEAGRGIAAQTWSYERDRWLELTFSLLVATTETSEDAVRDLVGVMDSLDLLDVSLLSDLGGGAREITPSDPTVVRLADLMADYGIDASAATRAIRTLVEAASGMSAHFDGKPQRYLRRYGELMVDELGEWFQFSELEDAQVARVFTYWLQNVASMPLSLVDDDVVAFCAEHAITPQDLVEAADELDLNLAVVDDVVQAYMLARHRIEEFETAEAEVATAVASP